MNSTNEIGFTAQPIEQTTNDVSLWNNAALQAIRNTKPGPTLVARSLAVLQTGVFDAWAAYDPQAIGTQLGASLRRPDSEDTLDNKNDGKDFGARSWRTGLGQGSNLHLTSTLFRYSGIRNWNREFISWYRRESVNSYDR